MNRPAVALKAVETITSSAENLSHTVTSYVPDLRVTPGPLLGFLDQPKSYETLRRVLSRMTPDETIAQIDAAGLRGRAGGGFPTGLKWWQVARSNHGERYFVCNAHAAQPGGFKERFLLGRNPHRILEAIAIAGFAVQAKAVILFLSQTLDREEQMLKTALEEARSDGLIGPGAGIPDLLIYRSPGGYVTGEETAALEVLEGRVGKPRGKPPLPTRKGLLGAPTAINNLETVLHAAHILEIGPERFRETGTQDAPGTLLFCLSGEIERPGLYELPLGTPLRELVFQYGGGTGEHKIKAVLAGGVSSRLLGPDELDVALDYDSCRERGIDLGSGVVIVISESTSGADLALELATFYHEGSCGKCQPCKDGTGRVRLMLERLETLDERSVDLAGRSRPSSPRTKGLPIVREEGGPGGISYTDLAQGLDKIRDLAEWYKYRGDCHHSTEAAVSIQSLLNLFHDELEARRLGLESLR